MPTTASVGCAAKFNITSREEALYMFGGQEDWRNSEDKTWDNPNINFSNRLYRLDLIRGDWKEIQTRGNSGRITNTPCCRSQSFIFIRKDQLYVYGGYDGLNIFSDLYRLDLSTLEWHIVEVFNLLGPRQFVGKLYTCFIM